MANNGLTKIIAASSAGTLIEWYDFYIFGSLAKLLSEKFFPQGNPTVALLATLATFATGFVVRPFGALVFGRMGDVVGRKHTFLLTLLLMGGSTALIGLLPTYGQIGVLAPVVLVVLRLVQGLALGGEYGGAATYVAEHAPDGRRGYYTSFIQTTATLGLLVSLAVIVGMQEGIGKSAFEAWGWRVPFLGSIVLVVFSYLIRRSLEESPMFAEMKATGATSESPLRESFLKPANRRLVLLALFGATAGQGVVWYTGQFYALYFLQTVLKFDLVRSSLIIGAALVLATPLFVVFGALSDRIGRKNIMMAGFLLAIATYLPIYRAMVAASGFDPVAGVVVGEPQTLVLVGLVFIQVAYVAMVYGPIAAFLVELFPTRIRYTSMSLPYHIGNGVFGGLVPLIGTAAVAATGNIYAGLFYPMAIAGMTLAVGTLGIQEVGEVALAGAKD
ncbi:MAG: MFS transporter [Chthonomonadaceae bacterium]|nr:MFS transporter [Chthonomonadaceae bacterium]